ncbi:hypothetical protein B0I28_101887 [Glycomyces artemisiae]|uniref:Uncharacterized protein n=2 Tax=Glycomyces artemisiae TaxID=1076443 RepID=A0A2T0UX97_9ACTN|nr:hypothetical protein B0I28_101887 [Glycomyces artemisiae]
MRQDLKTSVEELETALLEHLAPRMPDGIVLFGVEMTNTMFVFGTWVEGLESVRDIEALSYAFRSDVEKYTNSEGYTNLVVWVVVAEMKVRFDLYFEDPERNAAALRQYD